MNSPIKTTDDLSSNYIRRSPIGTCPHGEIVAATPVVKPAAEKWNRVVLVDCGDKFVVWYEVFPGDDQPDYYKSYFHNGSYHQPEDYEDAMKVFGERASKHGRSVVREAAFYRESH